MSNSLVRFSLKIRWGVRVVEFVFAVLFALTGQLFHRKPKTVLSVLIIEPFGLGDLVLLTAMIPPLRRRYPSARIGVVCNPRWAALFERAVPVDHVISYEFPWVYSKTPLWRYPFRKLWRLIREIRAVGYDVGIDIRGDVRSMVMLILFGCRIRIGYTEYVGSNVRLSGWLLTDRVAIRSGHRVQQNLALLAPLRCETASSLPLLKSASTPPQYRITFHFGALWEYKRWKAEKWAQLIEKLHVEVGGGFQFLGHVSESLLISDVAQRIRLPVSVQLTETIPELIDTISAGEFYIGLDSGAMHVATALGQPVIGLFGPGDYGRFHPFGEGNVGIHKQHLYPCAPCQQRTCIHSDFNCMDAIEVDEVVAEFMKQYAAVRDRRQSAVYSAELRGM